MENIPPTLDHEHLSNLEAAGVCLQLPDSRFLPPALRGCVIRAGDFRRLHAASALEWATARAFLRGRDTLVEIMPDWHPYLRMSFALEEMAKESLQGNMLHAMGRATEIWPPDDREI